MDEGAAERLYERAVRIRDGGGPGLWLPIMAHLALRGHSDAMIEWAHRRAEPASGLGRLGDRASPANLYGRALRAGNARAAQHLAMERFNRGDLGGYRGWLSRAARVGDAEAREELRRFELRLPHASARAVGRGRPVLARDGYGYWRGRWRYPRTGPRPR